MIKVWKILVDLIRCEFNGFAFSLYFCEYLLRIDRDTSKLIPESLEPGVLPGAACAVCPWDEVGASENAAVSVSVCPWDEDEPPSTSKQAIAR